jgi:hypothetical protein
MVRLGSLRPGRSGQAEVMGLNLYTTVAAVAGIASATVAVVYGSIDSSTYVAIVVGALGIAGVTHTKTGA